MVAISSPVANVLPVSGLSVDGQPVVSVLVKRTYRIIEQGSCVPSDIETPLVTAVRWAPGMAHLPEEDVDIFPIKPMTDIVIKASAYTGTPRRTITAEVRIGESIRSLLVTGRRQCTLDATGKLLFSEPEPFERMPVRYDHAYGGRDAVAASRYGYRGQKFPSMEEFRGFLSMAGPFLYPRNPCGKGYIIEGTRAAVDRVELPNVEDPSDPVREDRLVVGHPHRWPWMPLPQSLDWVGQAWFPRLAYLGVVHSHEKRDVPIREVIERLAPADILDRMPGAAADAHRFSNGASLALQRPYCRGDESILLQALHPRRSRFVMRLPGERPKIRVRGRSGKLESADSVVHTITVEPDQDRLTILWRGAVRSERVYLSEELQQFPFLVEW